MFNGIAYAESVNGGASFVYEGSFNLVCNACDGSAAQNPQFIADPAGGYDLTYYDLANVQQTSGLYMWGRSPQPMPLTFTPGVNIQAINFDVSRTDMSRLGDYTGLAATATNVYMSYVDNTSGNSHVRVHVAPLP